MEGLCLQDVVINLEAENFSWILKLTYVLASMLSALCRRMTA